MNDWDMTITGVVLEATKLKGHRFFIGVQFHPCYQSSKDKPHPLLVEFLSSCKHAKK